MDEFSSSKVTVEYFDPSGVFPLISSELNSRLPLRNLHWKSPSRPLRSIGTLHVDYIPSAATENFQSLETAKRASTQSLGNVSNPDIASPSPGGARRHQIPGLRRTPYLKVYFLRCDDSETYKASQRKLLNEWIKSHGKTQQGSNSSSSAAQQDNHNAYEWLIVHVVLPGSAAAAQPRWTGTSGGSEKSSGTKLLSRSSNTLFEKIRSHFNSTSKNAPDRVAQVRVKLSEVPPEHRHLLPKKVGGSTTDNDHVESPKEQNYAWTDLIAKSKNLILLSFDSRVGQYEDDIKQKDSQRALPGWNFCTFFILKEGLARGLESVGLVEDALVAYDELAIGLDSVMQELTTGQAGGQATSFPPYTEDVFQQFRSCAEAAPDNSSSDVVEAGFGAKPIDTQRKNYRDLILGNKISIFEFRTYIFARQMILLQRLSNVQADPLEKLSNRSTLVEPGQNSLDDIVVGTKAASISAETEDLTFLAELCERGLAFISNAARDLRRDILAGMAASKFKSTSGTAIENFVSSWMCSAAIQVLEETRTSSLPVSFARDVPSSTEADKSLPLVDRENEMKFAVPEPKTMIHPARASSLLSPISPRRSSVAEFPYAVTPGSGEIVYSRSAEFPSEQRSPGLPSPRSPRQPSDAAQKTKPGLEHLAAGRAELHLLQRRALESVGKQCGWSVGWAAFIGKHIQEDLGDMEDVSLENDAGPRDNKEGGLEERKAEQWSRRGLYQPLLASGATSIEEHRRVFERLTELAIRHYTAGNRSQSTEALSADMAALKFELGDYESAAMIFNKLAPQFRKSGWNYIERALMTMYARCLRKLDRDDQYVDVMLGILAKAVSAKRSANFPRQRKQKSLAMEGLSRKWDRRYWLNEDEMDTSGLFSELLESSSRLSQDVTVSMSRYFGDVEVEPIIQHFDDHDGFRIQLLFKHHLEDEIKLQVARVRLICVSSNTGHEVTLESEKDITLQRGQVRLWVQSNVGTSGVFVVDRIVLEAHRIHFVHEPFTKPRAGSALGLNNTVTTPSAPTKVAKKSRIACFLRPEALQATIRTSKSLHIDRTKILILEVSTGWNEVESIEIRLKSGSAGLRLRTADAKVTGRGVTLKDSMSPGVISTGPVDSGTVVELQIPYELENTLPEITIRTEVSYTVKAGSFQFLSFTTISIDLPLDVNVYDHFKADMLFSKFNIKAANNIPLKVLGAELEGTSDFTVQAPMMSAFPLLVFPRQPAVLSYKILPKEMKKSGRKASKESPLTLMVKYRCLDEVVLHKFEELFTEAIKSSEFDLFRHFLSAALKNRLQQHVLQDKYEAIALLQRVDLGSFGDMAWDEQVDMVPLAIRDSLKDWLRKWHSTNRTISLEDSTGAGGADDPVARDITITVPIPRLHILHTASLDINDSGAQKTGSRNSPSPVLYVGQSLNATLRITHTRRWDSATSLSKALGRSSGKSEGSDGLPVEFIYEILANPEVWLVGGQRKRRFEAREGQVSEFDLVLVPLRQGRLMLPGLDVRWLPPEKVEGDAEDTKGEEGESVTSETVYESAGETVTVVANIGCSTVDIRGFGTGVLAEAVLAKSEPLAATVDSHSQAVR